MKVGRKVETGENESGVCCRGLVKLDTSVFSFKKKQTCKESKLSVGREEQEHHLLEETMAAVSNCS